MGCKKRDPIGFFVKNLQSAGEYDKMKRYFMGKGKVQMRNKMKRLFCRTALPMLFLTALLMPFCLLLAGCGNETEGEASLETEPPAESSAAQTSGGTTSREEEQKEGEPLLISHINIPNQNEGDMVIIAGSRASKLGELGNFAWWCVYVFDWDAEQNCFVLTDKQTNASNFDKSDVKIPQYGFAYCINKGNDYSADGGINYITERVSECYDRALKMPMGTKAYLYGTHLYGGAIHTNGKDWYAEDFETDSFLMLDAPAKEGTPYDPVASWGEGAAARIRTTQNANVVAYANGECLLFTPEYGTYVTRDYSWWYGAIFAWDATRQCYVCVATDFAAGAGNYKELLLPPNGFVILDCASASKDNLLSCVVGTKAWLYEDPENAGRHIVSINMPEEDMQQILLGDAGSEQLATPQITTPADGERCTDERFEIRWEPVEGAASYTVAINLSTPNALGNMRVTPTEVKGGSYVIPEGMLKVGNAYTVSIYANGADGKSSSVPAVLHFFCVSRESLNSTLAGKTVLAFGDSLTARSGWVSMLGGYIGTEVINAGVGGDTTVNGMNRFESDVLARKPDIALICFGMNDQAQVISSNRPNISTKDYTSNLTHFVTELQKIGTEVIFICPHDAYEAPGYYSPGEYGINYAYGNMKDFCEAMRQVAVAYGCDIIDIYAETQDADMSTFLNVGDGIHQSVKGHTLWAEYVSAYLRAKYDDINAATVTVTCKDESGKELASYSFTSAVGAKLFVPAKAIEGMTLSGEETLLTVQGSETVTYTYTAP